MAQYPNYIIYDIENGLPSNEVYSIEQDANGFLWIGCDAGLYKFDGIRYTAFTSKLQNSKSITGLSFSSSGRLYCFNFQSQLFYLNGDSLTEIPHDFKKLFSLETDDSSRIYVNHSKGIAYFDERSQKWTNITYPSTNEDSFTSSSTYLPEREELRFISSNGIGIVTNNRTQFIPSQLFSPAGNFLMTCNNNEMYIFSKHENLIYKERGDSIVEILNTKLNEVLFNRKITRVEVLADGNLWICTFKGIIKYNFESDTYNLFYPELSFSDCMIDREGLYWFSTLQAGLLRVVDLNFPVWNKEYTDLKNDRIIKICTDSSKVFFANSNGTIGMIDIRTKEFSMFNTPYNADVQSLDYDFSLGRLYFNINGLFYIENSTLNQKENEISSLKSIQKVKDDYIILSSFGVYVEGASNYKLCNNWSRQLIFDKQNEELWIATNEGLVVGVYENGLWKVKENLLASMQVLSIAHDPSNKHFFALSFKGEIYVFDGNSVLEIIEAPVGVSQVNKIQFFDNSLYLASNSGMLKFDLEKKTWTTLNTLSGLVSNSIQDFVILNNAIWLATGKGVQTIPLKKPKVHFPAKIFLRGAYTCMEESKENLNSSCYHVLKYGQDLVLDPEVSHFASNGQFEYAYRINESNWFRLPASLDKIRIPNIPNGKFTVALKVIDVFGEDSENTIVVRGIVKLPFWRTWWFILILTLFSLLIVILIAKRRINKLEERQLKEVRQLKLENELRLTQQMALQAQMNPHFIFNVLNSIKGYIYENDKKNAALYLSRFSSLVRRILEQSAVPKIKLTEEIETIKLYIQLESLLLDGNFEYDISIEEDMSTDFIRIPNLLIQPLVENAFKHGLRHRKEDKKLEVAIGTSHHGKKLKIVVTDNGVGREAAAKINRAKQGNSFASGALHQRIKLLNDEQEESVSFEIEDLKDGSNSALGTRVTLYLNI